MKKSLFSSVLGISLLMASTAFAGGQEIIVPPEINYFTGFFVGGTGAFHQAAFEASSTVQSPEDIVINGGSPFIGPFIDTLIPAGFYTSNPSDGNAFDGFGGVRGGVGKVFAHHWYLGVVGFSEWGSQSDTHTVAFPFPVDITIPNANVSSLFTTSSQSTTTVKISNDYGVAGKLGYLVGPRTMVYGKIGAEWANIKVSNNFEETQLVANMVGDITAFSADVSLTGAASAEDTKVALLLGAGFEQFIYKNIVSLNAEYDYANFGTVETNPTILTLTGSISNNGGTLDPINTTTPATVQTKANAKVSTFLGGVNLYFGGNWF